MTSLAGRKIELWVESRDGVPAVNPIIAALLADLAGAGVSTRVRVPEHEVIDPSRLLEPPLPDLVLLKTATTLALSLAVADEVHGARFLNAADETLRAHDKAATVARLAAKGLPVPATFLLEPDPHGTPPPTTEPGRWVVKATRGIHGRGVAVHSGFLSGPAAHLDREHSYVVDDGTWLVQQHVGGESPDLKVYVAGDRCFAGAKAFGPLSYASDGIDPIVLDRALQDLVLAIGRALDLRCFGVDLRFEGRDPVVIDVNPFPGYRGFPAAVPALRSEIERVLETARE